MLKRIAILFFISSFTLSFSQGMFNMFSSRNSPKKLWQIGVGADMVSFSDDDVDYIGDKRLFQIPRFNVTNQVSKEFAVDLAFSINGFDDVIGTNDASYFSADASGRYYVLVNQDKIDPYVFTGISLVNVKDIFSPSINVGVGMTIWLTSNLGINGQALYKAAINKRVLPSHSQISGGIVFGFDNQKKINQSRCSFNR